MATFLKDCNDSKEQGHLMIFDQHRDGDFRGGHPGDHLEDFDHSGEGGLTRDGDHPKKGGDHRDGDHPRDGGCLRDIYHPKGMVT